MKLYYPSKVWTFAIITSTIATGLLFSFSQKGFWVYIGKSLTHLINSYTLILPFYFVWIFTTHYIIKNTRSYYWKKINISFLGISITFLIVITFQLLPDYFSIFYFDYIAFGIMLVVGIWYYPIVYQYPYTEEDLLDDNFHAIEK